MGLFGQPKKWVEFYVADQRILVEAALEFNRGNSETLNSFRKGRSFNNLKDVKSLPNTPLFFVKMDDKTVSEIRTRDMKKVL